DTAALTDSLQKALTLPRGEAASLAAALQMAATLPRSEAVSLTESVLKGLALPRGDQAALSDALQKSLGLPRSDAATLSAALLLGLPQSDAATLAASLLLGLPKQDTTTLAAQVLLGAPKGDAASLADASELTALGTTLAAGWSSLSIPLKPASGKNKVFATSGMGTSAQDGLMDPTKVTVAYKFDAASQSWKQVVQVVTDPNTQTSNTVSPLEAIVVRSTTSHPVRLAVSQAISEPPTRDLSGGWNLVGMALPPETATLPANQALASLYNVPTGEIPSFTQVVAPPFDGQAVVWAWNNANIPSLRRWRGYWVFMNQADSLAGFSMTPAW
ncbi:MAG: hypothetical protein HYY01_08970, partial [Chloroflexi bacterium]|nr:hypothetical protein [Chloroflexota bacterium]